MGVTHSQATQRKQVQLAHERERVDAQSRTPTRLSTVVRWGWDRRLSITGNGQHIGLTSVPKERTWLVSAYRIFPGGGSVPISHR
jgi:hypothetical protein